MATTEERLNLAAYRMLTDGREHASSAIAWAASRLGVNTLLDGKEIRGSSLNSAERIAARRYRQRREGRA